MNNKLKSECHYYVDLLSHSKQEKRCIYRWLGRKMHIKGIHFKDLNTEQLLHARRILRERLKNSSNLNFNE